MIDKKLIKIVERTPSHALKLHYLGINVFDFPQKTLAQICQCVGLRCDLVIKELNNPSFLQNHKEIETLSFQTIEAVIAYLRRTHRIFMRHKLPFMKNLIEKMQLSAPYKNICEDLKIAFPLFCEDFVKHILEEENKIFKHINLLSKAAKKEIALHKLYFKMEKCSLIEFANHHELDDDDMRGIRELTNNYKLGKNAPLMLKVLYKELLSFEKDLQIHARIENKILIPKALILENKIKKEFRNVISKN